MSAFTYPARFAPGNDGRVLVEFVDLPRVATDGKNDHEAMEEAVDALGSDLSIRLSRREEIPVPSAAKRGERVVSVPLWLAPKLALYLAMRDQRITNSELARRLGVHETRFAVCSILRTLLSRWESRRRWLPWVNK